MIMLTSEKLLKIGEVSIQSDLPIKTIRYYEELGLLTPTVSRSTSNYRLFKSAVLSRLIFIKRSQSLGLSLREIQNLLQVHDQGRLPCEDVKQNLQKKVKQVTEHIEALHRLRSELQSLLADWQDDPPAAIAAKTICPNLAPETSTDFLQTTR
jgi:DNA-binding transcriptional MerR regulator